MRITILFGHEFNQTTNRAKTAASEGPAFIAGRSKPGHVPPSIEDCRRIAGKRRSIVDAPSTPGLADTEFDPPRARDLARSAESS